MSYFPLLSNPIKPKFQASYTLVPGNQVKTIPAYELGGPGGIRTLVQQLILGHAKISLVNLTMISCKIRFKAIYSLSDAFSILSWVANPLEHIKRLETLFHKPLFVVYCPD